MTQNLIQDSIKLLREMVAIPSPSFEEEGVKKLLCARLDEMGIPTIVLNNNIVAFGENFSPEKRTLMLCAHIDTVPPAEDYDFDPYKPDYKKVVEVLPSEGKISEGITLEEAQDTIIAGLGSNDDGASVVSLIATFRYFHETDLPINLMLVLSAEEERSGKRGMDIVWKVLKNSGIGPLDEVPNWAIVGEPTGMKAAVAERGLLVIDGTAHGVSGHAAREEGVNALYIAMEDINRMRKVKFDRRSEMMGGVKLTVTQMNAGSAHNVIPDKCTFVADVRPNEQYTNAEILAMLQEVCKSDLQARNLTNSSSATAEDSPLLEAASRAGIPTFVSPTTSDWMRIGCDAIKLGPGDSARSHHKNEYVTGDEIREGVEKYVELIENFAKLQSESGLKD